MINLNDITRLMKKTGTMGTKKDPLPIHPDLYDEAKRAGLVDGSGRIHTPAALIHITPDEDALEYIP
jgi:hypothetical protein